MLKINYFNIFIKNTKKKITGNKILIFKKKNQKSKTQKGAGIACSHHSPRLLCLHIQPTILCPFIVSVTVNDIIHIYIYIYIYIERERERER